jgi:ubiquinone/menaquinone biosynthesis C-methylase UbiE
MTDERRPFLDFYGNYSIVPVSQDITDLARHLERRAALYRHCGLPPGFITGKRVLEIGPGTGHNAIYTNSLKPARYLLLDGNTRSLQETKATLSQHFTDLSNCEVIAGDLHQYDTDERFDLVLCEGTLPTQKDPQNSLRQISRFVAPGGMLLITCIDSVSWLSELLRLFLARLILPDDKVNLSTQLDILRPVFRPHLETLRGRSRPVDDWIQDSLLQPLLGELLPMEEAISALNDCFDVYGSSPHFLNDWRWYKDIHGEASGYNQRAINSYQRNIHNLMDYRYVYTEITPKTGAILKERCAIIYELAKRKPEHTRTETNQIVSHLQDVHKAIPPAAVPTAEALAEYIEALKSYHQGEKYTPSLRLFCSWFGRGQQYLSFLRRPV